MHRREHVGEAPPRVLEEKVEHQLSLGALLRSALEDRCDEADRDGKPGIAEDDQHADGVQEERAPLGNDMGAQTEVSPNKVEMGSFSAETQYSLPNANDIKQTIIHMFSCLGLVVDCLRRFNAL